MATRKAEVIYVGDAASLVRASMEGKAAVKALQDQASKSSGLNSLPQLGGNIALGFAAAAPAAMGLVGALGAVAASAGAAMAGIGALAVGGLGALGVGLGSIDLVAKSALSSLSAVSTALSAQKLAIQQHGEASKQATTATSHLNAVTALNGGAPVLNAAKSYQNLQDSFQGMTQGAHSSFFAIVNQGLAMMQKQLPVVAQLANKSMGAFDKALQPVFKMLGSGALKSGLESLAHTFSQMIGPAVDAVAKVFQAFTRIAVAAGPSVVSLSKGVDDLARKFANATKDPQKLRAEIQGLVSQTKSWLALGGALTRLIFDVFKQGASSGKGLVDSLTKIVGKWDQWAKSAAGSKDISNFFHESSQFARELFSALGPVVKALTTMSVGPLPIYVSLMGKLKGIMGPLTYAFVAYKVALVAGTVAQTAFAAIGTASKLLMNEWTISVISATAATVAQSVATKIATAAQLLFDMAMDANPIMLVATAIAALVAGIVYLATQTRFFTNVWNGLKSVFNTVKTAIISGVTAIVPAISGAWNAIKSATSSAWGAVSGIVRSAGSAIVGAARSVVTGAVSAAKDVWHTLTGIVSDVWHGLVSAIKGTAGAIAGAAKSVVSGAVNAVKGFFNTLYDIGHYLISGLISGVESMAGAVLSAIKSVVMAPVNAVKGALGIHSPSTVFHSIGVNIMQGLTNGLLSAQAIVAAGLDQSLLFPVDAAITALQNKSTQLQTLFQNMANAQQRTGLVQALSQARRQQKHDAGAKETASTRSSDAASVKSAIQALQQFDLQAKQAQQLAKINIQVTNLQQLKAFQDGIASLRTQVQGLAQQAAQVWQQNQTTGINATHDAAIAAINGGPDATLLAQMQSQDTATQNAATLAGLNTNLTTAQTLAANSGGQQHLDALQQVKDAQAAIDAFNRQQTEQQLQDNITAATKKADDAQTVALNGLNAQTQDYENSLDTQLGALTDNLNQRKINYKTWAQQVNAILTAYGLSVSTDSGTEAAVDAGPGPAGSSGHPAATSHPSTKKKTKPKKHHRAMGGPVVPGYVYTVGENGPEDVAFGQPGMVMTAAQTRQRGRGATVNIEKFISNSSQSVKQFADRIAWRASIGVA